MNSARREPLPIDEVLEEVVDAVRAAGAVVLRAPTGAGKTTRVPPALFDAGVTKGRVVLLLQPRRVAARAAAARIAQERNVTLGREVGYEVRFEKKAGLETKIKVVTEGILLRMLQEDPFLEEVGAVLFDELHERNLAGDLALAMVRKVREEVRPDLAIVAMSATLDPDPIARFLGNCRAVECSGRLYPVDVRYVSQSSGPLPQQVSLAVRGLIEESSGGVLVFLPGVGEIRQVARELADLQSRANLEVLEFYGDLPSERQDAVLRKSDRQRIVLSTNVAETSLTIDGITAVVDSGLARQLLHDPAVGLDRLVLTKISKASADQRAGRAGRLAPGVCLRLWSEAQHRHLSDQTTPEIHRVDLAGTVLTLRDWGETDLTQFGWFEPPSPEALERADRLLEFLDLSTNEGITELGRLVAQLPVHPRIGRLLAEGHHFGYPERAALLGALLSERDPFLRSPVRRRASHRSESDVLDRLAAIEAYEATGNRQSDLGEINVAAARFLFRARDQLSRLIRQIMGKSGPPTLDGDEAIGRALLAGFPDRLARRRKRSDPRGVMVGGRGVRLMEESAVLDAELFLCIDIDAAQGESLVRQASAVERDWLDATHLRTATEIELDAGRESVIGFRRTRFADLILEEAITDAGDMNQIATVLATAAASNLTRALNLEEEETRNFLARVASLSEWMPELGLPKFDEAAIVRLLPQLSLGCRSFADLRKRSLVQHLLGELTAEQRRALDRYAPQRLPVPSGRQVVLRYEAGRPPVLAARIQELFGMKETPRIAGGRVAVLFHLLAPNYRPQQVTDDLASFWQNTYPIVRKELRRRYPKHAWPESP